MDFDELEPSTDLLRRVGQAALFLATALVAGVGFAYLADSNGGSGGVRMQGATEAPYAAHLTVAPRADRLPKAQQAAPTTPLVDGEDAAFAEIVERALAETHVARAPTVSPTGDFGPAVTAPPVPVARPEPPAPAIAQYDEPHDRLIPMESIPQHEYVAAEFDGHQDRKARPLDALGAPFEFVGRTVSSLGDAVASIARPSRRY